MTSEHHAIIKAAIYNPDEEICAESQGVFRVFAIEEAIQLGLLEKEILEEIREKFSQKS